MDPGLAGGLRAWLEDGVAGGAGRRQKGDRPLVVDAVMLTRVLAHRGASGGGGAPVGPDPASARAALMQAVFRQVVTAGRIDDPMGDALGALEMDPRQAPLAALVRHLPPGDYLALAEEVTANARALSRDWAALTPGWWPRTRDPIAVPLAAGRVVLRGTCDLLLGTPSVGWASVCVVHLGTGAGPAADRHDRRFLALLETLRSGAPPFRVATYSPLDGTLEIDDVTDGLLAQAVTRTIDGLRSLVPDEDRIGR